MRRLLRSIAFATFACACAGVLQAAQAADCRARAIERLRMAPQGFAVYQAINDKAFFLSWLSCDEAQLGLPTAVHESVHYITSEIDAFPLVGGGRVRRPHAASKFFAPSRIAGQFKASDFVTTYLQPGSASAAGDFLYLLDELNAYTHDLNTAVALSRSGSAVEGGGDVDHRDGLAALMAFVALYVAHAQESEPATWSGLRAPAVARAVSALWGRAETVMASSCGIPDFGSEDTGFIRQLCERKPQAALATILGRAPVCPRACLNAAPVASRRVDTMPTGSLRATTRAPRSGED